MSNNQGEKFLGFLVSILAILAIFQLFENDNSKIISTKGKKVLANDDEMGKLKDKFDNANSNEDIFIE